jgi:hypothetical protein
MQTRKLGLIALLLIPHVVICQWSKTYKPSECHDGKSTVLINFLDKQFDEEYWITSASFPKEQIWIKQIVEEQRIALKNAVRKKVFIKNNLLEDFVNSQLSGLVTDSFTKTNRRTLILRSTSVNAMCYGRGIFIVTLGMLAQISSCGELAFALGHELAHDELFHVPLAIEEEARFDVSRKTSKQLEKIIATDITLAQVEAFKKRINAIQQFSRSRENHADSLGMIYLQQAGHPKQAAVDLLHLLEQPYRTDADVLTLLDPLNSKEYPIQDQWFLPRLAVYSKEISKTFLFDKDSLRSHPETEERISRVKLSLDQNVAAINVNDIDLDSIATVAKFELVESTFVNQEFDKCLFYAVALLQRFPNNDYLVSRVAEIFLLLAEAKKDGEKMSSFASNYTLGFSPELQLFNNLIFNIAGQESAWIGFHFINKNGSQANGLLLHQYFRWRFASLTGQQQLAKQIEKDHKGISKHRSEK